MRIRKKSCMNNRIRVEVNGWWVLDVWLCIGLCLVVFGRAGGNKEKLEDK